LSADYPNVTTLSHKRGESSRQSQQIIYA